MKKFKFSLETVLSYKQQVLDSLQGEHAVLLARVREQENVVEELWAQYRAYNEEYKEQKSVGISITDAMMFQSGLRALEDEIARATKKLEDLRRQEEKKREEVVEAKKDTSSIEKLREKKMDLYQKAVQKSEEAFIDEYVSSARAMAAMDAPPETASGM